MDNMTSGVDNANESLKKRGRESDNDISDDAEEWPAGTIAQMTRSERKRDREKKRRSDVNKAFDDLTSLLWEIDPTLRAEAGANRLPGKGGGPPEPALLSRVDLINRATHRLRRLHYENEQNKSIIAALTRHGSSGSGLGMHGLALDNRLAGQDKLNGVTQLNEKVGEVLQRRQTFLNDPFLSRSAAVESNQLNNQLLLNRLLRSQASNSGLITPSTSGLIPPPSQDILNRLAAQNLHPQGNLIPYPTYNNTLGNRVGIAAPIMGDLAASLYRHSNPPLNATELSSEQQLHRKLSPTAHHRPAVPEGSADMTQNLWKKLQERQAAAAAALNLADPDKLPQQRPGAGNDSSH